MLNYYYNIINYNIISQFRANDVSNNNNYRAIAPNNIFGKQQYNI